MAQVPVFIDINICVREIIYHLYVFCYINPVIWLLIHRMGGTDGEGIQ